MDVVPSVFNLKNLALNNSNRTPGRLNPTVFFHNVYMTYSHLRTLLLCWYLCSDVYSIYSCLVAGLSTRPCTPPYATNNGSNIAFAAAGGGLVDMKNETNHEQEET